ncbi:DNA-3-methyladenine glycosylase 2 family protein [Catellatospora sp. NPDC049609]|uniref:DNA-3-methyladenine glycosylase family protein n=1 Tax=Catellatospora sp. NPDC049609 TaxID=3155505 RepID=UPI00341AE84F
MTERHELPERYDIASTLGQLSLGRHDPCSRWIDGVYWMAARTPQGPGSLALRSAGGHLHVEAYGEGAGWLAERADAIAGLRDDVTGFAELATAHPFVARLAREHAGLRLPATGLAFPRLLRAVCEQKVTGTEAYRAYSAIVRKLGSKAPGPAERLWLPPDPEVVAATPYYEYHPLGLEQRRADTLRRVAAQAARLERRPDSASLTAHLLTIRGIGPWTAAETAAVVFGDPDAVSVGDFHLPNFVCYALAGEPRGTDARMLELLAPFTGHRGRVCHLIELSGLGAPKYGPRMPIRTFRTY